MRFAYPPYGPESGLLFHSKKITFSPGSALSSQGWLAQSAQNISGVSSSHDKSLFAGETASLR
uniref:Uncharacterized protein n=1 Tax=Candidatus Kentrum sp. LPFa TaxID=2126335 RepID=A0A450WS85_9GAMM|nr:MAG: hypothetical protein BECKLPF1236B_GA0070989_11902 [Candidatus Kentron sp. LPFa]